MTASVAISVARGLLHHAVGHYPYTPGPLGDRLTPRKSFAIWKETVRGKAHPWTEAERQFAEAIRLAVVEILLRNSELLADERTKAAIRQRMLNEELNHRVKRLCCTNRVRDSSCESSVVAWLYEQTNTPELQDQELARL